MQASDLVRILRRRALVALIVIALVIGGTYAYATYRPDEYRSSATIALLPDPAKPSIAVVYSQLTTSLLPTYVELVSSRSFLDTVASELPFPTTGERLQDQVFATSSRTAGVIKIVARASDPARAAAIARATTNAIVPELERNGVFLIDIIDDPRVPDAPANADPVVVMGAGVVLALFLGVFSALVWDRLFGRITSVRDLTEASPLPVLAAIPKERSLRSSPRVVVGDPSLRSLEENLRGLAMNLVFVARDANIHSIAITSVHSGEGKSTIVANLAVIIAELDIDVLVVDADLHRPSQHKLFEQSNARGLSSLAPDCTPSDLVLSTSHRGVSLVPAGPMPPTRSAELDIYLHRLEPLYGMSELVLVDTPPLRSGADVRLLANSVDGVVLVVGAGVVNSHELRGALEAITLHETRLLGTILNRTRARSARGHGDAYYGYHYKERAKESSLERDS